MHTHRTDLTELHRVIPKDYLPVELGGTFGTLEEHFCKFTLLITTQHVIFLLCLPLKFIYLVQLFLLTKFQSSVIKIYIRN